MVWIGILASFAIKLFHHDLHFRSETEV